MYINNECFDNKRNIINIANIRYCFMSKLYNLENLTILQNLLGSYIDILTISLNNDYSISIKLKKTSMRKRKDFNNNGVEYYNSIIPNIMSSYLSLVEPMAYEALRERFDDPYSAFRALISNRAVLQGLMRVSCINDNIVIFYL